MISKRENREIVSVGKLRKWVGELTRHVLSVFNDDRTEPMIMGSVSVKSKRSQPLEYSYPIYTGGSPADRKASKSSGGV